MWDIPTMPKVKKLDSKRRVVFPDVFKPGDVFLEETVTDDSVSYSLVAPDEDVPLAKTIVEDDLIVFVEPVSRELIAKAIREERDSR